METERVTEKIIADAEAEAEEIKQQAQQNQSREQQKLDKQLEEFNRETESLAKKAAGDKEMRMLASERMDIAKMLLGEKRKILASVFENAHNRLVHLPDDQYRAFITRLMKKAVETGDEEIILDKNESRIDDEFVQRLNDEIGSDKNGGLRLCEDREDLGGGFVLRRGKIKTNVTFRVLLSQVREDIEGRLAGELFKE